MRRRVVRNQVPTCCCSHLGYVLEPIVRLADEEVIGHELLARPMSGEGFVAWSQRQAPATLQQVAEALLRQLSGAALPPGLVFVNVTATDLERSGFGEAILASAGTELCARLVLEVTEARPIADRVAFAAALRRLRGAGVRLAVDDVGEGWSNLDAVRAIQPEVLKVALPLAAGMLGAWVVHTAGQLGAATVVERIERASELDLARDRGFTHGQGFRWAHQQLSPVLSPCWHRSAAR